MIYINASESGLKAGLGKVKLKKVLKKIKLKTVVKQVGKVAKFAAPIAAGFIPVGGGVVSKLLDSKIGKGAVKLSKSKVGSAVLSQTGIKLPDSTQIAKAIPAKAIPVKKKKGFAKVSPKKKATATPKKTIATPQKTVAIKPKVIATKPKGKFPVKLKKKAKTLAIGSKGEDVKVLQEELGVKPDGDFGPKTQQALEQATGQKTISAEAIQTPSQTQPTEEVPQGEITAVKPYEELPETQGLLPTPTGTPVAPKNNTVLLVGGAVALAGIAYLATKKSK